MVFFAYSKNYYLKNGKNYSQTRIVLFLLFKFDTMENLWNYNELIEESTYSGSVENCLFKSSSYERVQTISMDTHNPATTQEVLLAVDNICERTDITETRFDFRSYVCEDFDIMEISKKYPSIDYSIRDDSWKKFLTLGYNFWIRQLNNEEIWKLKTFVCYKAIRALDRMSYFESYFEYVLSELDKFDTYGLTVVNSWVSPSELFELWWGNFGWDFEDIKSFLENTWENDFFAMRDKQGELIAACMVSYDSESIGETTEWAVSEKYQWKGLIHPLLFVVNARLIDAWIEQIYAHARYNRSVSAGVRSWYRLLVDSILTNHVEVEWWYTHLAEIVVDKDKFTPIVMDEIRKYYPKSELAIAV